MTAGHAVASPPVNEVYLQPYGYGQKLTEGQRPGVIENMGTLERRRRERDRRRNKIIEAAEKVLLAKGYQAATMDDVASEAELGKGTLYLYFKNKDELILALGLRMRMRMIDGFDQAIQEASTGHDLLLGIARSYCEIVERHRDLFMLSFHLLASGYDLDTTTPTYALWRESGDWSMRIVVNAIERGKIDGSIRPDADAARAAMHLFGGALGVTLVEYGSDVSRHKQKSMPPVPMAGLTLSFMEFFIQALANPEGGSA